MVQSRSPGQHLGTLLLLSSYLWERGRTSYTAVSRCALTVVILTTEAYTGFTFGWKMGSSCCRCVTVPWFALNSISLAEPKTWAWTVGEMAIHASALLGPREHPLLMVAEYSPEPFPYLYERGLTNWRGVLSPLSEPLCLMKRNLTGIEVFS